MSQALSMNNSTQGGSRRGLTVGIFLLVEAAALLLLLTGTAGKVSTFVLASKRAGVDIPAPNLVIPTWWSILIVAIVVGLAGIWQLIRGFKADELGFDHHDQPGHPRVPDLGCQR